MSFSSRSATVAALVLTCAQAAASVNFEPAQIVRTAASDAFLYWVQAGDLDGDGDLDLVADEMFFGAGPTVSNFRVLRNDGGLVFTPGASIVDSGRAWNFALLQVDGDGDLDLVALVGSTGSTELVVYPGDGAGGFGAPLRQPLPTMAFTIKFSDVDADGDVDAAWPSTRQVAGPGGTVTVRTLVTWLDAGAGFAAGQTVDLPDGWYFDGFIHWDDDAYPDALLRHFDQANAPQVLRGSATGFAITSEPAVALTGALNGMALVDVDGTGVPELVTLVGAPETEVDREDVNCALRIHARGGDGLLSAATAPATRAAPCGSAQSFVAQDLDADGAAELIYGLTEGFDFGALGHYGLAGGSAPIQRQRFMLSQLRSAADLDGDGRLDLLAVDGDSVIVARGSALPNRLPVAPTLTFYAGGDGVVAGSFATTDPDGNPLSYTVIDIPDMPFGTFGYSNDGIFDFEWTSASDNTVKRFTVRVSDRSGTPVDYVVTLEPGSASGGGGGGGGAGGGGGGAIDLFGLLALLGLALLRREARA